ncbi:MAG: hypothetical protein ACD_13C00021G0001, partial [uncultured bacterium]
MGKIDSSRGARNWTEFRRTPCAYSTGEL